MVVKSFQDCNSNSKINVSAIPDELKSRRQWVVWRYEGRAGKPTKPPFRVADTKRYARHDDPNTWSDFDSAVEIVHLSKDLEGLGYVFSKDDPYTGADLDNCLTPEGEIKPWAADALQRLNSYDQPSPSDKGVKVWVRGKLPGRGFKHYINPDNHEDGAIEMYDQNRYFTVTAGGDGTKPIADRQEVINALYEQYAPKAEPKAESNGQAERNGQPQGGLDGTDEELLVRARTARNGDKFVRLWGGDRSGYGSDSEADAGLCGELAFWCGPDPERIDRLFRQSELMRDKWEREDYRDSTIDFVLRGRTDFYRGEGDPFVYATETIERVERVVKHHHRREREPDYRNNPLTAYLWKGHHARDVNVKEAVRLRRAAKVVESFALIPQEGFIPQFVKAHLPATGTPVLFLIGGALSLVSAYLNRRVWVCNSDRPYYPNLLLALFGPSGERKSIVLDFVQRFGKDDPALRDLFLSNEATYAAFVKSIAYPVERMADGKPDFATVRAMIRASVNPDALSGRTLMILDELGGFMKALDAGHNAGFKEALTTMYACPPEYSRQTATQGSFLIHQPWISALGATTLRWFLENVNSGGLEGGWISRWLCLNVAQKDYRLPRCDLPDADALAACHQQGEKLKSLSGEFFATEDAWDWYSAWYNRDTSAFSERMYPWINRGNDYALKIALLFEASSTGEKNIGPENMRLATQFIDLALAGMTELADDLADNPYEQQENKIVAYVRKHAPDWVNLTDLTHNTCRGMLAPRRHEILRDLHERGVLEIEEGKERVRPTKVRWIGNAGH